MAEERKYSGIHNLILEGRAKLSISGVTEVESFDEQAVILHTEMGMLEIKGNHLHIHKLNVETGDVAVEGEIDSAAYEQEKMVRKKGLFW